MIPFVVGTPGILESTGVAEEPTGYVPPVGNAIEFVMEVTVMPDGDDIEFILEVA